MKAIQLNHFVKVYHFNPHRHPPLTRLITRLTTTKNINELHSTQVPNPQTKTKTVLSIKITHAAITHVDLLYAQGLHQNNRRHVKPPFILGTEFTGIVTSSPPSSSFKPGTRVFGAGLGAYAESICVPESSVRYVPEQWTLAGACAVGASGAVSYGALVRVARVEAGETVLVLGASGGLGVMAIQIAKAFKARVIAVVGNQEKAEVVRSVGADEVVNYHHEKWVDEVKKLTKDGEGVDVVYDAIGAVESGVKCLKYRGRLVIVGFAARGGGVESVRTNRILLKSVAVYGYRFGEDGRKDPQRTKDIWDGFMGLVEDGKIWPVVYKEEYEGLESVGRALEDARTHKTWGRAVLRINEEVEIIGDAKARL
jgi:NADPH:quinone reductase-like Zn-dependent oxidoreductase